MGTANFEDFYEVPNLNFDISKLRKDLDKVLKAKKFNSPGVTHFGAIPLNQIPNDRSSIEGNNIRGKYWTIADETGKEVSRDVDIDESKYTQLVPEFENTYFKEVYDTLRKRFKLGRVRLLLKEPRSTLSWHKDNKDIKIFGPLSPDSCWNSSAKAWRNKNAEKHDGILAMYHDQGLIPMKVIALNYAVNTTIGLPFIRTSPDHGTGFDIAGKGIAQSQSMIEAIKTAIELTKKLRLPNTH